MPTIPTVLVTRAARHGARFAAALSDRWHAPLQIVQSPLLRIKPLPATLPDVAGVVLTSANGAAQAARLGLRPATKAYCVGDATARAAQDAGLHAIACGGTAEALVAHILAAGPDGPLAHLRGTHARGDVAGNLTKGGILCHDVIAYDQEALALTPAARDALAGNYPVILPLFSPRTAAIFAEYGPFVAPLHLVGISSAVRLPLDTVTQQVAKTPDMPAMLAATLDCLRKLETRGKAG